MRRHLIIILLAIVGLFLGTNGFTQGEKGPGVGDTAGKTTEDQRINAFMVGKIIGSKVINLKGEPLGKIENLVVDIDTGKIVYAVLGVGICRRVVSGSDRAIHLLSIARCNRAARRGEYNAALERTSA